jgi:photosystem II stability/assembly factor-like uncharacterized protein
MGSLGYFTSVYFTDPSTGYVAGHDGILLKTTDGGTIWTFLSSGTQETLASLFFTDANTGFMVGGYNIYKTTNGGTSWNFMFNANTSLYSIFFPDPNTGYAVGGNLNNGIIAKTTDGGTNWTVHPMGTPYELRSVYFIDSTTGYTVGHYGTILKTTNGGFPVGINAKEPVPPSLKLYPNPASLSLFIEMADKGTLVVLNLSGTLLFNEEITKPGTTIDVSNLPSGLYIVKVIGNNEVKFGKFIKE